MFRAGRSDDVLEREFPNRIRDFRFAVDRSSIALGGDEDVIRVWNLADDSEEQFSVPGTLRSIAWNSDSGLLVVGATSCEVHVMFPGQFAGVVQTLRGHGNNVHTVSVTRDSRMVASSSWDGTTRFWNLLEGVELQRLRNASLRSDISEDQRVICRTGPKALPFCYRLESASPRTTFSHRPYIRERNDIAFHPGSSEILACGTGVNTMIWNLSTQRVLAVLPTLRTRTVQFSADGLQLLTSGQTGVQLWRLPAALDVLSTESVQLSATLAEGQMLRAAGAADLSCVAALAPENQVLVLAGEQTPALLQGKFSSFNVTISPDGKWIVPAVSGVGETQVFDSQTGDPVATLSGSSGLVCSFSPDGRWLAGASAAERVLWDTTTWQEIWRREQSGHSMGCVDFSPDARLIALPTDRFSHDLVDRRSGRTLLTIASGGRRGALSTRFSNDGTRLGFALLHHFETWNLSDLKKRFRELQIEWSE